MPPVEEARPVSATGLCWREARLAASCTAPPPVVEPAGVSDARLISPGPLCGAGGEKTEETRARGEHSDGRVLSAGLHHNNAKKSTAARTQCDPISLEGAPARFGGAAGS